MRSQSGDECHALPSVTAARPAAAAFLGRVLLLPAGRIFRLSFAPEGDLWAAGGPKAGRSGLLLGRLWFTVWQAAVSTALTLALALPGAYVFARYRFRGRAR